MTISLPPGFAAHTGQIGLRADGPDFVVVAADSPVPAAAVYTKSRFAGPSVVLSRANTSDRQAQAVVVVAKNANVATGPEGAANAAEVVDRVAAALGARPDDIVMTSTGVIGRQYPMDLLRRYLDGFAAPLTGTDATAVAAAMMTTDTHPKVAEAVVAGSEARVVGVAKGVGMIEPDMATMLTFLFTDAEVAPADLDAVFRRVVDRTFNCLSVDTDTSTSDTAAILANGRAGPVDLAAFEAAVDSVALDLTRQIAADGEGAETLLVVIVTGARDDAQAKLVAKAIVNSPLVKTAVHGADPNWGRVAMAIGKCSDETDIDEDRVTIRFGEQEVYPASVDDAGLAALERYMAGPEVLIAADLGIAGGSCTVYGCDLTDGYVRINADYTT
ncbi:MAG: bifunctional glutamate N-acetyltransferase/amino-acid acetyltransferase ArgJ [Acidimicrobiales bacterium]|nr:bifunctional glutamate N-acetyltransferase/amino-acid acetyltransferase ArgJ [Acidimicrobiales bacterium]